MVSSHFSWNCRLQAADTIIEFATFLLRIEAWDRAQVLPQRRRLNWAAHEGTDGVLIERRGELEGRGKAPANRRLPE